MKSLAVRLSFLTVVLFCVALVTPTMVQAQDTKPIPESPRTDPPPSPPAEAPRNDPPPSPPAEAPRSDPAPSAPSTGGGSSNNDNGGNRNNERADNENRRSDNDNRRNNDGGNRDSGSNRGGNANPTVDNSDGGTRTRGTMSGDGSGNRRDRVIETDSGEIVVPGRTRATTPDNLNPGGTNPGGGNPGGNPTTGGGNPSGNPGGRHRDRDRDRDGDRDRWRDRHGDRRGHRHYRGDECYQVPTYNDTVTYSAISYPAYDPDDSLSAYDRGYNDGLFTGANDGRRGQTYDPGRSHFYKRPVGYHSHKGNRADYEQAYRDGFLRGYREGYQNWQKYFVGGRFRR